MGKFEAALSSFKSDLASDIKRLEDRLDRLEKRLEDKVDKGDRLGSELDEEPNRLLQTLGFWLVVLWIVTNEPFRGFWDRLSKHVISSL